jgi:hypothetical protein
VTLAPASLPVYALLHVSRIAIAHNSDLLERGGDGVEICRRKFNRCRADALLQSMQLRSTRDRHDPRFARKQSCKRDLRAGGTLVIGDLAQDVDEARIGCAIFFRETRCDAEIFDLAFLNQILDGTCNVF